MGPSFTRQAKEKPALPPGIVHVEASISPEIDWTPGYMEPSHGVTLKEPRIGYPAPGG